MDHQTSPEIAAKELYVQQSCYLTALRHGQRYVEEMDEWDVTPETDNCIREDGVYLITGGTDGIGLEVARYFSTQARCHLILASRNGFPHRTDWTALRQDEKIR